MNTKIEKHELNETTYLEIIASGRNFALRTSPNLYATLRKVGLIEGESYQFNDLIVKSLERAKEIMLWMKEEALSMNRLQYVQVFIRESEKETYEKGETVDGSFYFSEHFPSSLLVLQNEINQAMKNNTMAAILKGGWSNETLDAYYDNF